MIFQFLQHIALSSHKRLRWLLGLFVGFLLLAGIANYAYFTVLSPALNVEDFTEQIHRQEAYAEKMLGKVVKEVQANGLGGVSRNLSLYEESERGNVALFIFKGDSICWWSSKNVDVRSPGEVPYSVVFYFVTHNSHCIGVQRADSRYRYVAIANLKQKANKGSYLPPTFEKAYFSLPADAEFVPRGIAGSVDVSSRNGTYLFSIKTSHQSVPVSGFLWAAACFVCLALVALFCLLFELGSLKLKHKLPLVAVAGCYLLALAFVSALVLFGWPDAVFESRVFSPAYYTSGIVPSLGHLAVCTVTFSAFVFLFYRISADSFFAWWRTRFSLGAQIFLAHLFSALVFLLVYCLTVSLVYHSAIDVATSLVQDISGVTVVCLLFVIPWFMFSLYLVNLLARNYVPRATLRKLLFGRLVITLAGFLVAFLVGNNVAHFVAWGIFSVVSLSSELYCYFRLGRTMFYVAFQVFSLINLTVSVCHLHCSQRNALRYVAMADSFTQNVNLVRNEADERILLENGRIILSDARFHELMADTSEFCFENVEHYLLESYFDGFDNKYEFEVQVRPASASFMLRKGFFENSFACSPSLLPVYCNPVAGTRYLFLNKRTDLPLSYACVFPHKGKVAYVFVYPYLSNCRHDQDTEYNVLANIVTANNDISVVKYYNGEMLFASGDYHYPNTSSWIPNVSRRNFRVYKSDCTHYIARFQDSGFVVVTKVERGSYTYFIFVSYLCGIFAFGALLYGLCLWANMQRRHAQYSFLTRMQIWLLGPLLFAFLVLGACSMYFFQGQYKGKAVSGMSQEASSIQLNLQQKLGFCTSLDAVDQRRFSQDVKDLSNLFQADVVIYDLKGREISSSRTTFLNKRRRLKRLMFPVPLFTHQPDYFREVNIGSYVFFSYYTNLYNQRNQKIGYVNVRSSAGAEQMKNELFNLMVVLVDVYLVIVFLTIIISWLISRRFTKPVSMLADQFKEIKLTGSNQKVEYADNDEFGSLVQQYNIMVDKLQLSAEQLAQSQRELAWRDMARRIAHEIKNPLTPMKLSVQMAQMKVKRDPENFPEYFDRTSALLIEQIDNLSRIASEFSTFAKTTVTVREEVDLAGKVQSVVALFEHNPEGVAFRTDMHGVSSAMVWSDNKQILQVFNNLFRNAIQAIPDGKEGVINVGFQIKEGAALVSVADNGCGIPPENLHTIFEPNFTTKTSGMGLGLSIVKTIVNMAGGEIWVESEVGVGTTFFISIPLIKPGDKPYE